ncbi:MAG: hypothetical protein ACQEXJ_01730 [Myxococcota bacterium]
MERATTLVEAIQRFSPRPIEFGVNSTNERFYVERIDDPLSDLRVQLISSQEASDKTLLAGHRGSGKSTELNRLAADPEIQALYRIVSFSVRDSLELTDVDHVDLLLTLVARTYEELSTDEAPLALSDETVRGLERWRNTVVERMERRVEGSAAELGAGADVGLLGFLTKFSGRLRFEHTTRDVTRETIEPRIGEFLHDVHDFFLDVQLALQKVGKRLLVLVEDLDKLPDIEQAETLFHDKQPYLSGPPVRIVYTVPIALHYSKKFAQVAGRFGESVFLPNVRLVSYDRDGKAFEPGRETMRQFALKRMDASLVDEGALEAAVDLGGGLFQQMQRLLQKACTKSVGSKLTRLGLDEVKSAAADLRAELERQLSREDITILHEVHDTLQASSDEATLDLLHYLHLVEYRNSERWCDVNPLLLRTLDRWKPDPPDEDEA